MEARRAKLAVASAGLVIVALLGVIIWQRAKIRRQDSALALARGSQSGVLSDGTGHATAIATAPGGAAAAAEQMGAVLARLRENLTLLGANANSVVASTVIAPGRMARGLASSASEARPMPASTSAMAAEAPPGEDRWGYTRAKQTLRLTEPFAAGIEVPFGTVSFSAWQREPWDVEVTPRTYKALSVGATDAAGKRRVYTQFFIEADGRRVQLPVSDVQYVEDAPSSVLAWRFHPMLSLGVGPFVLRESGVAAWPGLGLQLAGFGPVGGYEEWSFATVGFGFEPRLGEFGLSLVPAAYNVGGPLPWVDNLFVGPQVAVGAHGAVSVGLALQVGL